MSNRKISLEPIITLSSKVLILGSMPGDLSLLKNEYYANPKNHFWKIMFDIFNSEELTEYESRKKLMLNNHIALWDVLKECERKGSLDSNIRNVEINDISELLNNYPNITTIILNGGEANKRLSKKYRERLDSNLKFIKFPSTSPVPGKNVLGYDEKLKVWSSIKTWL